MGHIRKIKGARRIFVSSKYSSIAIIECGFEIHSVITTHRDVLAAKGLFWQQRGNRQQRDFFGSRIGTNGFTNV